MWGRWSFLFDILMDGFIPKVCGCGLVTTDSATPLKFTGGKKRSFMKIPLSLLDKWNSNGDSITN